MPHYKITLKEFPQLINSKNVEAFKKYIESEYAGYYYPDENAFYAHNEADSLWFIKDFYDNKSSKSLIAHT